MNPIEQERLIADNAHRLVRRVVQEETQLAYLVFDGHPGEYTPETWSDVLAKLEASDDTIGDVL